MQVGEILVRAARAFDRIDVGPELDEIAEDETRGGRPSRRRICTSSQAELRHEPERSASVVRLLDVQHLHADDVMDHPLQFGVERDQKWYRAVAPRRGLRDVFRQQRAGGLGREIGGQFGRQLVRIGERKLLGVGLDEKIEGIDDREFGRQIDLDLEFLDRLGEDVAREPVAVRVRPPIDGLVGRRDVERVAARHPRAAMGRRTQSDRLGAERDRTVVAVTGDVIPSDQIAKGIPFDRGRACLPARARAAPQFGGVGGWRVNGEWREQGGLAQLRGARRAE